MESLIIKLSAEEFDRVVHKGLSPDAPSLPQASQIHAVFKPGATVEGKGMVVIAFEVEIAPGKRITAQATTTAELFIMAGIIATGYRDGGHLVAKDRN